MKEVLLHCCCAPCSSAILEWMLSNDILPVLYYCNPNIFPEEEYYIRKNEITRYARQLRIRIIDDDSSPEWHGWQCYHDSWRKEVEGMEDEPERGKRCLQCFKTRLLQSAKIAQREGIDTFTTTLASSRWKNLQQINDAGTWAAEMVSTPEHPVTFDTRNWRKGGLQQRRNELLRENNFYNQQYCGCEFSIRKTQQEDLGTQP